MERFAPLCLSISEACRVAGIGRTGLYKAINERSLIVRKAGRRTLVPVETLRQWLAALPEVHK
jgi:excisionase family DNA binding protein